MSVFCLCFLRFVCVFSVFSCFVVIVSAFACFCPNSQELYWFLWFVWFLLIAWKSRPPLGHQSLSRTSQGKQAAKSRIACVFDWCSLGWGLHCCSQVVHICQPYCAKLGTLDAESVGIYAMSRASGSSLVRSLNPFNDIWGRRWCNFLQNQMCIILADRVIILKYHFHAWISFWVSNEFCPERRLFLKLSVPAKRHDFFSHQTPKQKFNMGWGLCI